MSTGQNNNQASTLFGHPPGLFTLFFAEMWERFSYYGMRALLIFYMIKGFLGYGDKNAYAVYGSYTALVYMTPFFGGMIADRLLGARRAVILGGLLMAAGHLLMTLETKFFFFMALALLIAGNGFFKPNISTIVGSLYPQGSPKRDGGFTIFYIGINLGAAMSPLLCGYIGETYGWHYGFGLATIGMLAGIAVFVMPRLITQLLIMAGAIAAAFGLFYFKPDNPFSLAINFFVGIALLAAGVTAWIALGRGGLPPHVGAPRDKEKLRKPVFGPISAEWATYALTFVSIPVFAMLVSGFALFGDRKESVSLIPSSIVSGLKRSESMNAQLDTLEKVVVAEKKRKTERFASRLDDAKDSLTEQQYQSLQQVVALAKSNEWEKADERIEKLRQENPPEAFNIVVGTVLEEMSKPAGLVLLLAGIAAFLYLGIETFRMEKIPRERMFVVLILTFFSMLFWAFFEQAGSSVNNFTDRNVDRVFESRLIAPADVGSTISFRVPPETTDSELSKLPVLSQEQLGHKYGDKVKEQIAKAIRIVETRKNKPKTEKEKKKLEKKITETIEEVTESRHLNMTAVTYLRDAAKKADDSSESESDSDVSKGSKTLTWKVLPENEEQTMKIGGSEMPASIFQAINPVYILLFGVVFTALWTFLGNRGLEPNTPVKFSLGLLQLGLGFGAIWIGAQNANERGMVALYWLFLGYLLHTTGELCLSPVGLSMVTKLSPSRLVATVMGTWFLATAFSQFLAAIIAMFTRVSHSGGQGVIPVPSETVNIYGDVFGTVALVAMGAAAVCFIISPILSKWMHEDVTHDDEDEPVGQVATDADQHEDFGYPPIPGAETDDSDPDERFRRGES